jgi:thymidylate synthase (FAD)
MRIIKPSYEIITEIDGPAMLRRIEAAGRTCYKSEDKITDDSAERFVKMLIKRGHHSVIEHEWISVRIVCDRGVSHEIVRHRLASYSQESTRYCDYSSGKHGGEISVIDISGHIEALGQVTPEAKKHAQWVWARSVEDSKYHYKQLRRLGIPPEIARSVLVNSLKTELVMTCNVREWRHFFSLRADKAAHPQMREIAQGLLVELRSRIPVVFDDVGRVDCESCQAELIVVYHPSPNEGLCFVACECCDVAYGDRTSEPQAWAAVS